MYIFIYIYICILQKDIRQRFIKGFDSDLSVDFTLFAVVLEERKKILICRGCNDDHVCVVAQGPWSSHFDVIIQIDRHRFEVPSSLFHIRP